MNAFLSKPMSLLSLLVLTLAVFAPALEAQSNKLSKGAHNKVKHQGKIVKYVQGGACGVGKGTKKHPYTSLAQAQADTSWDVLIVLPSTVALDGGITLRSGTKLIGGGEDPTAIAITPDQPTITNSSAATNGGNGVVVTGDATIKNIYFKDTWVSAVNYDEGENVCIKKVLVTGHNQGDVLDNLGTGQTFEVAGIYGNPSKNGKTSIKNVIIRNNHTGSGIIEIVLGGAHRQFAANRVEVAELTSTNTLPTVSRSIYGILLDAFEPGTIVDCKVKNCYIHDFLASASSSVLNFGIDIVAENGGKMTGIVTDCTIDHLHNSNQIASFHINGESLTRPNQVSPGVRSQLKLTVEGCSLSEPQENTRLQVSAVQVSTRNSTSEWAVRNSSVNNVFDNFVSFNESDGVEKISLIGNTTSGFETFYAAVTGESTTVPNPKLISDVLIKNNTFTGGNNLGAIVVIPNFDGADNPWDRLTIKAENNCFNGQGTGFAGLLGFDFGSAGAGNATITAHCNSIVGYDFDILDFFANIDYLAQRNFWGQGSPCVTGADCADTQICEGGVCVGPDNVLNLGTGIVDVSNPLRASIKCPNTCCETIGGASPIGAPLKTTLSPESSEFKEKLEKLKERFKNGHSSRFGAAA